MRVAARAGGLALSVHAVEDGGAVCGARPREGRWRLTKRVPVTCPSCLLALSGRRLAVCEVAQPTMGRPRSLHLRVIGDRGFKPREGIESRTLCGQQPSWDVAVAGPKPSLPADVCVRCVAAISSLG